MERLNAALGSRYQLERELGSGGMATVYLALDPKHNRKVAVKVLRPDLAATLGPARFLREIEIAAQLQHPHILPLLDSGESDGFLYYVMPYIEGESLRERLTRKGELPVPEAVRLLRDVADALSYAHSRGVVHRDIKPDNVMISGRHALVADFGVAKAVSEATGRQTMTTAGVALGTPAYMAPEQAAADPHVDHRADIYALGAMGYELLTGRPPFTGASPQQVLAAHVTEAPKPVTSLRQACPPALADAIMRCLAKRAADRWQSADQLLELLEGLGTPSGGSTPTHTQPTTAVRLEDPWYGHPVRVTGLFALASLAILGAVYFLTIQLGLPDWVPWGALALLAAGLPIMIVTGLVERRRARKRATGTWSASAESPLRGWITWRRAIRGGLVAFSVLGVGTLGYTAMRLLGIGPVGTLVASGRLAARDRMVVADFGNTTSDSALGSALSEAFRIDLGQSPVISVLSSSAVTGGLQRMGRDPRMTLDPVTARELALREGAKAVLAGEISQVGRGYVLAARLLSASDGAELLAIRENAADDGEILAALDRLSKRIRERVGESLRSIRGDEALAQVTTASLEALRLYTEGAHAADLSENERAAGLLRQAVAVDSGFAMAWRKLAVVLSNAFASQDEIIDAATRAYRNRNRLPEVERHLTVAYFHSYVDYDTEKTAAAYRAVLALNPDNTIALNNLGLIYEQRRDYPEAERLFDHARKMGHSAVHHMGYLRILTAEGKSAEAEAAMAEFAREFPGNPAMLVHQAALAAAAGQWDSAQRQFTRLAVQARGLEDRAGITSILAALEALRGHAQLAARHGNEFIAVSEARRLPGAALAGVGYNALGQALFQGDTGGALRALGDGLARYPLTAIAPPDRPYALLARAYAQSGRPDRARGLMKEFEAAVPEGVRRGIPERHAAAGYIALAEGRPRDAVAEFRAWRGESDCTSCALYDLGLAFERAGQPDSALRAYQQVVTTPRGLWSVFDLSWTLAPAYSRLGALYEEKGESQEALDAYSKFVDLWRDADPVLQPRVREVKERMAKLAGERPAS